MKRFLWLPLLLLGCSKDSDIQVYKVPKAPASAAPAGMPAGHPPLGGGPGAAPGTAPGMDAPASTALAWTDPAGWTREAGAGMRVASYKLPGEVECTVISLPGDAGGDLANANRWRGQMGLKDIASLDGASSVQKTPLGPARVVDFEGAGPQAGRRMVAAMLSEGGTSWFFKMTGPAGAVAQAKPGFMQLLGSIRRG
jgi:hypothetical protein